MSTQLPIVQYWHSAEPPDRIVELTRSFSAMNPERRHILFDRESAADFIVEHFGDRESAAFQVCGPPAMQADYLRYCAIHHLGGIWADAGFGCARNLSGLLHDTPGAELFRSYVRSALLMNGLFAFAAPGHPFLRLAIELSTELIERRWDGKVNWITGPLVISTVYNLSRAGSVDAFLDEMAAMQEEARVPNLVPYARLLCELIGPHERAVEACEGVRVHPAKRRGDWVSSPPENLPHRNPESHWSRMESSVYATGAAPPNRRP